MLRTGQVFGTLWTDGSGTMGSRIARLALLGGSFASVVGVGQAAHAAVLSGSIGLQDRTATSGGMGSVNLTNLGTIDWAKWGSASFTANQEKATGSVINTTLSRIPSGSGYTLGTYGDDGFSYTWTDGTPTASGSSFTGVNSTNLAAAGDGFRLQATLPTVGTYTLRLFAAASTTTNFRIDAALGTATDTDAAVPNTGSNGVDEILYTLTATSDAPNQLLTIDYVRNTGATSGVLALTAVTVAPEPASASLALLAGGAGLLARRRRRA